MKLFEGTSRVRVLVGFVVLLFLGGLVSLYVNTSNVYGEYCYQNNSIDKPGLCVPNFGFLPPNATGNITKGPVANTYQTLNKPTDKYWKNTAGGSGNRFCNGGICITPSYVTAKMVERNVVNYTSPISNYGYETPVGYKFRVTGSTPTYWNSRINTDLTGNAALNGASSLYYCPCDTTNGWDVACDIKASMNNAPTTTENYDCWDSAYVEVGRGGVLNEQIPVQKEEWHYIKRNNVGGTVKGVDETTRGNWSSCECNKGEEEIPGGECLKKHWRGVVYIYDYNCYDSYVIRWTEYTTKTTGGQPQYDWRYRRVQRVPAFSIEQVNEDSYTFFNPATSTRKRTSQDIFLRYKGLAGVSEIADQEFPAVQTGNSLNARSQQDTQNSPNDCKFGISSIIKNQDGTVDYTIVGRGVATNYTDNRHQVQVGYGVMSLNDVGAMCRLSFVSQDGLGSSYLYRTSDASIPDATIDSFVASAPTFDKQTANADSTSVSVTADETRKLITVSPDTIKTNLSIQTDGDTVPVTFSWNSSFVQYVTLALRGGTVESIANQGTGTKVVTLNATEAGRIYKYVLIVWNNRTGSKPVAKEIDVEVKKIPFKVDASQKVTSAENGAVTVSWHTSGGIGGAEKVEIQGVMNKWRCGDANPCFSFKSLVVPTGEIPIPDNLETHDGETRITVTAYDTRGNKAVQILDPIKQPHNTVDAVDVFIEGVNMGQGMLNTSLLDAAVGGCAKQAWPVDGICNFFTIQNIIGLAGDVLGIIFPGVGKAAVSMMQLFLPLITTVVTTAWSFFDHLVLKKDTIASINVDKIWTIFRAALPDLVSKTLGGAVGKKLFGDCVGSKISNFVGAGLQALMNVVGKGFAAIGDGNLPGEDIPNVGVAIKVINASVKGIKGLPSKAKLILAATGNPLLLVPDALSKVGHFLSDPQDSEDLAIIAGKTLGTSVGNVLGPTIGDAMFKAICSGVCATIANGAEAVLKPIRGALEPIVGCPKPEPEDVPKSKEKPEPQTSQDECTPRPGIPFDFVTAHSCFCKKNPDNVACTTSDIINTGKAVNFALNTDENHNNMVSNFVQRICKDTTGRSITSDQAYPIALKLRESAGGTFHALWQVYFGLLGNTKDFKNDYAEKIDPSMDVRLPGSQSSISMDDIVSSVYALCPK